MKMELRKPVKGKLVSNCEQSTNTCPSAVHVIKSILPVPISGLVATILAIIIVLPFARYIQLCLNAGFLIILYLAGIPAVASSIILAKLFESLKPKLPKYFQVDLYKPKQESKLSLSIALDPLDQETLLKEIKKFTDEEFSNSTYEHEHFKMGLSNTGEARSTPVILSFPSQSIELVKKCLSKFASLEIPNVNSSGEYHEESTFKDLVSYVKLLWSALPLSSEYKERIQTAADQLNLAGLVEKVVKYAIEVRNALKSAVIIVHLVRFKFATWTLLDSPSRTAEVTTGFCELFPRELITLMVERTGASVEHLVLSAISGGFSMYWKMMRGGSPSKLDISLGTLFNYGTNFVLPLKNAATDELVFLQNLFKLQSSFENQSRDRQEEWRQLESNVPSCLIPWLIREHAISVRNVYIGRSCDHVLSSSIVKSVYLWSQMTEDDLKESEKLKILVIYRDEGVSLTLIGLKGRPVESASLLAECIFKSVSVMCMNLNVKWDRRSPPSTPSKTC